MSIRQRVFIATMRAVTRWTIIALVHIVRSVVLMTVSLWIGVPRTTALIAEEWLERADLGGYTNRTDWLYWSVRATATIFIIFSWICFSFTTVFIVMIVF